MIKKITTDPEEVAKFTAFTVMMVLNDAGIVVHKSELIKLKKSLKKNLSLKKTASLFDGYLAFRINEKKKGQSSTL